MGSPVVFLSAGDVDGWTNDDDNSASTWANSSHASGRLEELNRKQAILHLPVTSVLALLMLIGVTGNTCVVFVYRTRFRKTSGNFFIMTLACLDLVISSVCVSWEIFRLCSPYKLQATIVLCKTARFLQSFLFLSAALLLVCVAFSRYYRIIRPLRCYSSGQAQSLTIVAMATALCLVWPQLVLSGPRTVQLDHRVSGQQCDVKDHMVDSIYSFLFHGTLYGVLILCFGAIVIFYFRILCVVCSLGGGNLRSQGQSQTHGVARDSSSRPTSTTASERSFGSSCRLSVASKNHNNSSGGTRSKSKATSSCSRLLRRVGRTTRMLILVTLVFLLGYLPSLAVHLVHSFDLGFQPPMSYANHVAYQLCLRSNFLSSAANPLIYSILNPRFRQESMVALRAVLIKLPVWIRKRIKGHLQLGP